MAKKSKSLIPPKLQIPVMVIGAVVLVFLLWQRLGPAAGGSAKAAPVTAPAPVQDSTSPDAIRIILADTDPPESIAPPVRSYTDSETRDPFHWPDISLSEETLFEEPLPPIEQGSDRPDLHLSGVLMDARGGIARINGSYLRVGDSIEGCVVRAIHETRVRIEDFAGTRELTLPEVKL